MNYEYRYYYKHFFSGPAQMLAVYLAFTGFIIYRFVKFFYDFNAAQDNIAAALNEGIPEIVLSIIVAYHPIYYLSHGGFSLLFDKKDKVIEYSGIVEDISESYPFRFVMNGIVEIIYNSKSQTDLRKDNQPRVQNQYGMLSLYTLTVSGKKFRVYNTNGITVGASLRLKALPKSGFVLEINNDIPEGE